MKHTIKTIFSMKLKKEKITALTAYDFLTAKFLDESGIDIILVGDSLSNVFQGNKTTLPVTLDEMIYHAKIVTSAVKNALVIVDMPFLSYQVSETDAIKNCGRIMKETNCYGVKLEGGIEIANIVKKLTSIGIPVMGHLGLTPQSINQFGDYSLRATEKNEAKKLLSDAKILETSNCFSIVLEKIPSQLAKKVTASVSIPTIGIGAGIHCDGQILVTHDILGMFEEFNLKFVRKYFDGAKVFKEVFSKYKDDVKKKKFPNEKESF